MTRRRAFTLGFLGGSSALAFAFALYVLVLILEEGEQ